MNWIKNVIVFLFPYLHLPKDPDADLKTRAAFEEWWKFSGQFVRSGGGEYEKNFAYAAWNAAKESK